MTSSRPNCRLVLLLILAAAGGGCSWLLPVRKALIRSSDIVLDSRRAPALPLSGCFIPATFPAITKLPIVFPGKIPTGADFTSVSVEVLLKNGDPLVVLDPVIEKNQVYLKFAVPKRDAFTQVMVAVTAKYEYR